MFVFCHSGPTAKSLFLILNSYLSYYRRAISGDGVAAEQSGAADRLTSAREVVVHGVRFAAARHHYL